MLIDYVVGGLQVILLGLIVSGGVLCAREGANRNGYAEAKDARDPLRPDRRIGKPDRRALT